MLPISQPEIDDEGEARVGQDEERREARSEGEPLWPFESNYP